MSEPFFFRPSNRSSWNGYSRRTVNWKKRYFLNFFPWQFLSLFLFHRNFSNMEKKTPNEKMQVSSRCFNNCRKLFKPFLANKEDYVQHAFSLARWHKGYCTRFRIERSGFESWPETLCCVLEQDTLLSQYRLQPRCVKWIPANLMLGVTLRWTSIPSTGRGE